MVYRIAIEIIFPITALLIFLLSPFNNLHSQVIDPERRVDWSRSGYQGEKPMPGNILNALDYGALGDSLTDNTAAIQDAFNMLNGCRGVIYFAPGTYLFHSTINIPDSAVIRGESSQLTHFVFDLGGEGHNCFTISKGQQGGFVNVVNDPGKGTDMIIVDDPSAFFANQHAELRQKNGDWDTNPISWGEYAVGQMVFIKQVSNDTIFIENFLRADYENSLDPEIRPVVPAHETGIECLKISRLDNSTQGVGYNIYMGFASNCWVKGVESNKSVGSHIYLTRSTNVEISGCYIHDAFEYDGSGTRGYGITLNMHTGQCLIENNILKHLRHALMVKTGANGNVFAYNFSLEPYRSEPVHDFSGDISLHGHYAFANLFEGNIVQNIIIDHYWGPSGPWNTMFRNRTELYGIIMTFSDTTQTNNQNFAGNEVVNNDILFGNYILSGENHFEYGNNLKGTIHPEGTGNLADTSYYRNSIPAFWDINAPWPPVGPPNDTNEFTIPARHRYFYGEEKTVCNDSLYTWLSDFEEPEFSIYPNPGKGIINVIAAPSVERVEVYDLYGKKINIFIKSNQSFIFPDNLSSGMYFIHLIFRDKIKTNKYILIK